MYNFCQNIEFWKQKLSNCRCELQNDFIHEGERRLFLVFHDQQCCEEKHHFLFSPVLVSSSDFSVFNSIIHWYSFALTINMLISLECRPACCKLNQVSLSNHTKQSDFYNVINVAMTVVEKFAILPFLIRNFPSGFTLSTNRSEMTPIPRWPHSNHQYIPERKKLFLKWL